MSLCLMLHGLGLPPAHVPDVEKRYWLPEATFANIIHLAGGARLTFDDGNDTDVKVALPALLRAEIKAAFFIPSGRIGTPHYLGEDDVRTLDAAGMEIGSHGCAHVRWTEVPDAAIVDDVTCSVERLSAIIGGPVRSVAVPYGSCNRRVLGVLRSLGIARVYSSFRGPSLRPGWLVRRNCITADMPQSAIRALLTAKPTAASAALSLLRTWRHAGRAALWTA